MTTAPLIQIDAEGTGPQMDFWHSPATFRALSGRPGSGKEGLRRGDGWRA